MEKKLVFSPTDMMYTVAGATVLTAILQFVMSL